MLCTACSPFYTWSYESSVHPKATQAYIQAILAREDGDYDAAVEYYDEALRYTRSQKVADERRELMSLAHP